MTVRNLGPLTEVFMFMPKADTLADFYTYFSINNYKSKAPGYRKDACWFPDYR